jgi:translation elongation factor EF-4
MDVLIDCKRKTVAAALKAMEVTRKIKVWNRQKSQKKTISGRHISR